MSAPSPSFRRGPSDRDFDRRQGYRSDFAPLTSLEVAEGSAAVLEDFDGDQAVVVQSRGGPVLWRRPHIWAFGGVTVLLVILVMLTLFAVTR
jgi:hypothetical protein